MRRDAGTVGSGLPDSKVSYAVNIFVLSSFCDASMLSLTCLGRLLVFLTALTFEVFSDLPKSQHWRGLTA